MDRRVRHTRATDWESVGRVAEEDIGPAILGAGRDSRGPRGHSAGRCDESELNNRVNSPVNSITPTTTSSPPDTAAIGW